MKNATNNLEKFKNISETLLEEKTKIKILESVQRDLLKTVLDENKQLFEEALYEWAIHNPIETIAILGTQYTNTTNFFYKNDNKDIMLFEEDPEFDNEDAVYSLFNKRTLQDSEITYDEFVEHFEDESNVSTHLKSDFIGTYKVELIKDDGFCYGNLWATDFYLSEIDIPKEYIWELLNKNFKLSISTNN